MLVTIFVGSSQLIVSEERTFLLLEKPDVTPVEASCLAFGVAKVGHAQKKWVCSSKFRRMRESSISFLGQKKPGHTQTGGTVVRGK